MLIQSTTTCHHFTLLVGVACGPFSYDARRHRIVLLNSDRHVVVVRVADRDLLDGHIGGDIDATLWASRYNCLSGSVTV